MKPNRPVAFAMGAITALVLGSGTAYAATGGKFILGQSNSESKPSTIINKRGTALVLDSKAGTPSLKVSRSVRVPNLNADELDGMHGSAFALVAGKTGTIKAKGVYIDQNGDGQADLLGAAAVCPSGTKLTGGGGEDDTADGVMWLSEPASSTGSGADDAWIVLSTHTPTAGTAPGTTTDMYATAQCYNPKGSVAGSSTLRVTPRAFHWGANSGLLTKADQKLSH